MSDWWNPFSLGEKDPSIMTKEVVDPLKQAVASPMSSYLAGQIGQGIGDPGMDPSYKSRYTDFMNSDANAMFDKNIYDPQMKLYNEQQAPLIDESFAGGLRGSGHYGKAEEGMSNFNATMGTNRQNFYSDITKSQLAAGQNYNKQAYDQWSAGLPQNNPALKSGLDFLSNNTGTGTTLLSAMDPGQKGWFSDLLTALITGKPASSPVPGNVNSTGSSPSSSPSTSSSTSQDLGSSDYIKALTSALSMGV
jgi:hypothetical protein